MKKTRNILAIIVLMCPVMVCAQQISVHSPTAANLGLYGEIPVSHYTGTPNISIPLYEIKGKQLTIPIRLSYRHRIFRSDFLRQKFEWIWNTGLRRVIAGNILVFNSNQIDRRFRCNQF